MGEEGDEGAATAKRHLVILDVNGMLVHRWRPASNDPKPDQSPDGTTSRGQQLFNRPYMHEAVDLLCKSFSVLVWSSMQGHNLQEVVAHCFKGQEDSLLGVWDQEHCTEVADRDLEEGFRERHDIRASKPIFLKELRKLEEHPTLAKFYPNNVLLIDDSEYKAVRNPEHAAIHPEAWEPGKLGWPDDELGLVCKYLKRLLRADTVTSFVQANPFWLWKSFQVKVLREKEIQRASGWCVRRAAQAEALVNIWEQELLKAHDSKKERLLSVATMAAKTARSVAQRADDAASTSAPAESVMPLVEAMWPCFPRAVRHTIRHCKPALDGGDLMKCVVDTFNHTFDPRRMLRVRSGESLGPLWREVEYAAKNNCLLPGLPEMRAVMEECRGDAGAMREKMAQARKRQRVGDAAA